MLYTGTLMTENAFYPLFLVVALALVATLERPTPLRQVVLLALCGLAFRARAHRRSRSSPAAATAPLLLALVERRGRAAVLRPCATLYGILGGGVAARARSARSRAAARRSAARRLPRRDRRATTR